LIHNNETIILILPLSNWRNLQTTSCGQQRYIFLLSCSQVEPPKWTRP